MATRKVTVGSLIDTLHNIRNEKRDLAVKEKEINGRYEAAQLQLMELMDKEGVSKSTGKTATASVNETTQFNIEDWESFMAFVAKTKQFHLIQRRTAAPAVRELWGMKGVVPGLTQFTKREISLRDL
jgi:hypothetical protein